MRSTSPLTVPTTMSPVRVTAIPSGPSRPLAKTAGGPMAGSAAVAAVAATADSSSAQAICRRCIVSPPVVLAHPAGEGVPLPRHLTGQAITELGEELADVLGLLAPVFARHREEIAHHGVSHLEPAGVDAARGGQQPDGRLGSGGAILAARDDPLEHAQILAEAGPDEAAVLVLAEPVHVEDLGGLGDGRPHVQPVPE